jgi:hypothetical protein
MVIMLPFVLLSYVDILDSMGTIKSHTLKYFNHSELYYTLADLPKLLPVHIFTMITKSEIENRIRCKIYDDDLQCFEIDKKKCEAKGLSTIAYELCMIDLITLYSPR